MKKLLSVLSLGAVLAAAVVPAAAEGIITISGQDLSIAPQQVVFENKALTGLQQVSAGTTTEWVAKDPSGLGKGWEVKIAAEDFKRNGDVAGSEKLIPIAGATMTMLDSTVTPHLNVTSPVPVSDMGSGNVLGAAQRILHADADKGMGEYGFTPTFSLVIPANTYAGSYTSVFTLTIAALP